jgi:hypothetical protein
MDIMRSALVLTATFLLLTGSAVAAEFDREPTQNPNVPYRLFKTQNIYTFLKLDTRVGRIWQVQWGDKDHRFTEPINLKVLVPDGKTGRLTLYPTQNIYTFILLDQETGDAWQVQWGDATSRFVLPVE